VGALRHAALFLICAMLLFPIWLMVTNGFTEAKQFLKYPPRLLPEKWTIRNYQMVFELKYLGRWILNTAMVVSVLVVAGVLVNGSAGYAFAFGKGKWLTIIFWMMMTPIFVTRIILLIAQFVVVNKLKMQGLPAVFLMSILWPSGIYLFKNFFREIPMSILESARMDGAGDWTVLRKIVIPMLKPIIGAAIVFLGMGALGDFLWQMLNLQRVELQTFIVGLTAVATNVYGMHNVGFELAIGTVLFIPFVLLFSLSSKYFIKGISLGGVKE